MDSKNISRAVFLGHSLGGFVTNQFVKKYPDRVSGIMYIGAPSIYWFTGYLVFN